MEWDSLLQYVSDPPLIESESSTASVQVPTPPVCIALHFLYIVAPNILSHLALSKRFSVVRKAYFGLRLHHFLSWRTTPSSPSRCHSLIFRCRLFLRSFSPLTRSIGQQLSLLTITLYTFLSRPRISP